MTWRLLASFAFFLLILASCAGLDEVTVDPNPDLKACKERADTLRDRCLKLSGQPGCGTTDNCEMDYYDDVLICKQRWGTK